jgi:predicted nucleic-acid-binding protein
MPLVSDDVLDNMTANGKIYENQFVFFQIVSVSEQPEDKIKFDLQYVIKDKTNDVQYSDSLKTFNLKFNGVLTELDTIEFVLTASPSFKIKKNIMLAAIERYNESKATYYDFLKL